MIKNECQRSNIEYSEEELKQALEEFQIFTIESLFIEIGQERFSPKDVLLAVYPNYNPDIINEAVVNKKIYYAKCCHPVPFEQVVSTYTDKYIVHRVDCKNITLEESSSFSWDTLKPDVFFVSRIHVIFSNSKGSLAMVAKAISDSNSNILNIKILQRTKAIWDVFIDIDVKDLDHLEHTKATLRSLEIISNIERV